jgi:hypothetical protein
MFSKMNSGQAPSNWRHIESAGAPSSSSGKGELNRSFRVAGEGREEEEDEEYDQEIEEDNEGEEDEDDEEDRE